MAIVRRHAPLALLLVTAALLHGRTIVFPFVNWDDPAHVYRNRAVVAPGELSARERWFPRHLGYPLPVVIASYRLDRALFGPPSLAGARLEQGRGFHLSNVLLTIILVALVYALAVQVLLRSGANGERARWAAACGAALFAFHPVAVEPIAWVSGRKDLLVAIGCVGATILWLRLSDGPDTAACWSRGLAFLGAGVFALASKPTAVMLLPLGVWTLTRGAGPRARRALVAWGSLALLGLAAAIVVALSLAWQRSAGALVPLGALETARRALWALGYHLALLVWPLDLRAKYLVEPGGFGAHELVALAALAAVALVVSHPRTRRGAAAFGIAFAFAAYLPQSNLVPLQRQLADSYLFLPLVGLAVAAAAGLEALCARRRAFAALALLLVPLAILSGRQASFWASSERLWRRVQRYHPENAIVCRMLGEGQIEAGEPARAIATYGPCVARFGLAPYANNLGIAYYLAGDHEAARRTFAWILARRPNDPRALKYLRKLESPARR